MRQHLRIRTITEAVWCRKTWRWGGLWGRVYKVKERECRLGNWLLHQGGEEEGLSGCNSQALVHQQ